MESRLPSGLFPSGPQRPTYREPHPVRLPSVAAGAGAAVVWLLLFGLLGTASTRSYVWWTVVSSALAGAAALVLARYGDRGVAVGVALTTGLGLGIAMAVTAEQWVTAGWPLW